MTQATQIGMTNQGDMVWVCRRGVYMSQMQAIHSAERGARRHNASPDQARQARDDAADGSYVRADLAPPPLGLGECEWTAAARRVRERMLR